MAGTRTEEPRPRGVPAAWTEFRPAVLGWKPLPMPGPHAGRDFRDVLTSRRSAVGASIGWDAVGTLLRHVTIDTSAPTPGRAGMVARRGPTPSAGGLQPIRMVCIDDAATAPRIYDPAAHAFGLLDADAGEVGARNGMALEAVLGWRRGCTVRFLADADKVAAAYEHPVSLVLRDAGCLTATLCLAAERLGMTACPLGFLGQELVGPLGFPEPRFVAVGGVQLGKPG